MNQRNPNSSERPTRKSFLNARRSLAAIAAFTLLFSGCAVGPNYQRAKVNVPTDFRGTEGAAEQKSIADVPWWELYKDDRLKELIQTALANNYDLRIAITRVEQARQIAAQGSLSVFFRW